MLSYYREDQPASIGNYFLISYSALVYYEYLITLGDEISQIWRAPVTATRVLFLLSRYPYLLAQPLIIYTFFLSSEYVTLCNDVTRAFSALSVLVAIAITLIFTLRTYTIYRRSWLIFSLLMIPGAGIIVTNIVPLFKNADAPIRGQLDDSSCAEIELPKLLLSNSFANTIFVTVFDSLVFILTLRKTIYSVLEAHRQGSRISSGIHYILLRDGTLYYIPLLLSYIAGIIFLVLRQTKTTAIESFVITSCTDTLQWLMVNRLVLNLSAELSQRESFHATTGPLYTNITARSFLGNIGAPLHVIDDSADITQETDEQEFYDSTPIEEGVILDSDSVYSEI